MSAGSTVCQFRRPQTSRRLYWAHLDDAAVCLSVGSTCTGERREREREGERGGFRTAMNERRTCCGTIRTVFDVSLQLGARAVESTPDVAVDAACFRTSTAAHHQTQCITSLTLQRCCCCCCCSRSEWWRFLVVQCSCGGYSYDATGTGVSVTKYLQSALSLRKQTTEGAKQKQLIIFSLDENANRRKILSNGQKRTLVNRS